MSKNLSIDSIEKNIKGLFFKLARKNKNFALQKPELAVEEVSSAKVTSKQIEAYYKRYGKDTARKSKIQKPVQKTQEITELDKLIQKECDAYNNARFHEVSEDAIESLKHNFEEKKQKIIDIILSGKELLSSKYIKRIKQIKTPEDLACIVRSYGTEVSETQYKKHQELVDSVLRGKVLKLEEQQEITDEASRICSIYFDMVKALTEKSKDARVIQMEDFVKVRYGMDYVHLESFEEAKKVIKALDLAVKNNIPLPKNIIITPFTPYMASGVNLSQSISERSIFIKSQKEIDKTVAKAYKQFTLPETNDIVKNLQKEDSILHSTDDELHEYLHELVHSKYYMPNLLSKKNIRIPLKYYNTARSISTNAMVSRSELVTELKTKSILRSLNKDEQELLNYLEK